MISNIQAKCELPRGPDGGWTPRAWDRLGGAGTDFGKSEAAAEAAERARAISFATAVYGSRHAG